MNWPRTCRWCSATAASSGRPRRAAGMAERPGVLRVGDRVLFGGGEHQVVGLAGNAVRLLAVSGQATVVALPFLLAAPDFAIVGTGTAAAGLAPRLAPQGLLDVLPEHVARAARDWERHLIEVLTGVPPDAPDGAAPRPEFDLARPLAERERAKAAELTAAGVKASARTVRRMRYRYREQGLWGLVDARHAPAARPAGNVDPRVVAAAAAVIDARAGRGAGAVAGDVLPAAGGAVGRAAHVRVRGHPPPDGGAAGRGVHRDDC